MNVALDEPAVRRPLIRACLYDAISMAFAYPDAGSVERLQQTIDLALREVGESIPALVAPVESVRAASQVGDTIALAVEHTRLFSGEVACSPYETEYESDPFAKSHQLADIAGFYHAFGVALSDERRTMADFVATEVEFMAILCRKEALAAERGWTDRLSITVEAETAFLECHLGRWVDVFSANMDSAASSGAGDLFRAAAFFMRVFVALEMMDLGASPVRLTRRMVARGDSQLPACDPRVAGPAPETD